jgi:hypothetical protein
MIDELLASVEMRICQFAATCALDAVSNESVPHNHAENGLIARHNRGLDRSIAGCVDDPGFHIALCVFHFKRYVQDCSKSSDD